MSVWEQRRKEREAQNQIVNQSQVQAQTFAAPVRVQTNPIQIQPRQNPQALGISVVGKSNVISQQSVNALESQGLAPPPRQQPQQSYQEPADNYPVQQPIQQQYQPAQPYQPPRQEYQQPQRQNDFQKPQQFQEQVPNQRQIEIQKQQNNNGGLQFNSYQPKPQMIQSSEQYQELPAPISKRQLAIENANRARDEGLVFNSGQPKREVIEPKYQPQQNNSYQQNQDQDQQGKNGKMNLIKKKPSEMTDKEYEEYEKARQKEQWKLLVKAVVWNTKASNFDLNEAATLAKDFPEFKKMYDEEKQQKQQQDQVVQQEQMRKAEEQRQIEEEKQLYEEQVKREAEAKKRELENNKKQQEIDRLRQEEQKRMPPPQTPPQRQVRQNVPQNMQDDEDYRPGYQPSSYQQPYQQPVQINRYSEIDELRTENKYLREKLRIAELDVQSVQKKHKELLDQYQDEVTQRKHAEKIIEEHKRELLSIKNDVNSFQQSLGYQPSANPPSVQNADQLPIRPAAPYLQQMQYAQKQNQPQQQKTQQQQLQLNQVDRILNRANQLINAYEVSDRTLAVAKKSEFTNAARQAVKSQMQPDYGRTLQVDNSVIQTGSPLVQNELHDLLQQDYNYNTMEVVKPPDDIPLSLLQSLTGNVNLPQNRFQNDDAEELIRKYSRPPSGKQ
ncbi:Conserved_hypothetical protein [Hexamita inflata]|uniref:Uncharacterized protein n=1 Tax=Hexamita inflata TaxID=28002 RepID=A0ABP1GW08_9EUKA